MQNIVINKRKNLDNQDMVSKKAWNWIYIWKLIEYCLFLLTILNNNYIHCNEKNLLCLSFLLIHSFISSPDFQPLYHLEDDGYNDRIQKIHHMSLPFDIFSLLPRSQQAEILFSTFSLPSMQGKNMAKMFAIAICKSKIILVYFFEMRMTFCLF